MGLVRKGEERAERPVWNGLALVGFGQHRSGVGQESPGVTGLCQAGFAKARFGMVDDGESS